MKNYRNVLIHLLQDSSGQDLIEYALVASLIALAAVVAMKGVASDITGAFNNIGSQLSSATSQ